MISVIMATYNRSEAIGFAIRSVLYQTRTDWELLVVGDACTDKTRQVVESFGDPRVRFTNLEQRVGDQSGPTRVAMRQARGDYLAFLNHDDLWFPDHLERSIAHLERTGSDLVYSLQLDVDPDGTIRLPPICSEAFVPFLCPNISTWTCRRTWAEAQQPMRPFWEVFTYPSEDWLRRAWKQGARFSCVPAATVCILTTLTRQGTYANKEGEELAFWFRKLSEEPGVRERLLVRALQSQKPTHLQGYSCRHLLRALVLRAVKEVLQRARCNPMAWVLYLRCPKKWGVFPMRGGLRQKLYRKRGLNIEDLCQ
jgi:glycosyltransferase involved in cell wall biosynthesis